LLGTTRYDGGRTTTIKIDFIEVRVPKGFNSCASKDIRVRSSELKCDRMFDFGATQQKLAVDLSLLEEVIGDDHLCVEFGS
jgi:hypothetical protein